MQADDGRMRTTYAVTWQRGDDARRSGRLELQPSRLALEGSNGNGPVLDNVPYRDLTGVWIARWSTERLSGRPTLVLARRAGDRIRIAAVAQPGMISELAEQLAILRLGDESFVSRVLVVLPLQPGASTRAGELLRAGPPFDPEVVGLERHQAFLTDEEAVFLFEADEKEAAERLVSSAALSAAAAAWKDIVAGPPRLAEEAYSWVRPHVPDDVVFTPTPGPGGSDGGDLY